MSTRSWISIFNKDKKQIEVIYCHFDGYLDGVGSELLANYRSNKKVKSLIALGDISCLERKVAPNNKKPHSFEGRYKGKAYYQTDVCIAYHRDRGEEWETVKPAIIDLKDFKTEVKNAWDIEYVYVYVKGKGWYAYSSYDNKMYKDVDKEFTVINNFTLDDFIYLLNFL